MEFRLQGVIEQIETIAEGSGIRELARLRDQFGLGNRKKKKGMARISLPDGTAGNACMPSWRLEPPVYGRIEKMVEDCAAEVMKQASLACSLA